jgi:hypothetical protein
LKALSLQAHYASDVDIPPDACAKALNFDRLDEVLERAVLNRGRCGL